MTNRGIAPLDPDSLVGEFRLAYGDTDYIDLDPPEAGYGDYAELSDAEIEMFLSLGNDSVARAIGVYMGRLATDAAKQSKLVKDYDLTVDLTKRANDFREQAQWWFDLADSQDDAAGTSDIFEPFGVPGFDLPVWSPEAAPRQVTF